MTEQAIEKELKRMDEFKSAMETWQQEQEDDMREMAINDNAEASGLFASLRNASAHDIIEGRMDETICKLEALVGRLLLDVYGRLYGDNDNHEAEETTGENNE